LVIQLDFSWRTVCGRCRIGRKMW